jgi:hypothetical protein
MAAESDAAGVAPGLLIRGVDVGVIDAVEGIVGPRPSPTIPHPQPLQEASPVALR